MKKNRNLELLKDFREGQISREELKKEALAQQFAPIVLIYPEDRVNPALPEIQPEDVAIVPQPDGTEVKMMWKDVLEKYKYCQIPSPILFYKPDTEGILKQWDEEA